MRKKQKGNGGHSKHHAQSDAGKEKGNGGHFLDKQKGKARNPSGKETQREWRTLSRQTKGRSKKEMKDALNTMRRRTRARKEEWRTLSSEGKGERNIVPRWD